MIILVEALLNHLLSFHLLIPNRRRSCVVVLPDVANVDIYRRAEAWLLEAGRAP